MNYISVSPSKRVSHSSVSVCTYTIHVHTMVSVSPWSFSRHYHMDKHLHVLIYIFYWTKVFGLQIFLPQNNIETQNISIWFENEIHGKVSVTNNKQCQANTKYKKVQFRTRRRTKPQEINASLPTFRLFHSLFFTVYCTKILF